MWATLQQRLKGYKTIVWSYILMVTGVVLGIVVPVMDALDLTQLTPLIPPKYTVYAPLVLIAIGQVTKTLRQVTTGPVGAKGDAAPAPNVKAGD